MNCNGAHHQHGRAAYPQCVSLRQNRLNANWLRRVDSRAVVLLLFILFSFLMQSCAAAQAEYDYSDLTVYSVAEHYFTLETNPGKTYVYYSVPDALAELKDPINKGIEHYGFSMAEKPEDADVIIVITLTSAQLHDQSADEMYGTYYTPGPGDAVLLAANPAAVFTLPVLALAAAGSVATSLLTNETVNKWVRIQDIRIYGELMVKEKIPADKESMYLSAARDNDGGDFLYLSGDGYLVHHTLMYVGARNTNLLWKEYKNALGREIADLVTGNYKNNTY